MSDNSSNHEPTLIFISGLGADSRAFTEQMRAFPNSVFLDWLPILPTETLEEYAIRLADSLKAKPKNCIVIGLSFGGMLAPYVAERLGAKTVILIASIRYPRDFPARYRMWWTLAKWANWTIRFLFLIGRTFLKLAKPLLFQTCRSYKKIDIIQLTETDTWRFGQTLRLILDWGYGPKRKKPNLWKDIRFFHIHGKKDSVLPIPNDVDLVIPDCGHVFTLSHAELLNEFIRDCVQNT